MIKVRLFPDVDQAAALRRKFGCRRWLWNRCVALHAWLRRQHQAESEMPDSPDYRYPNLENVPEALRPAQEPLDPDEDVMK